jgi:two-component system response regulator AtoC
VNEREIIRKVLDDVGGNRKQAAAVLGISLRTLQYRIKEYGL